MTTTPTRPHALLPNGPSLTSLYAPPPTDPTLTVVPPVGHTVVELSGDLGGAATAALRERLLVALRHSEQLLVLDLSAVTGCDAAALAVLIGTQRRAQLLGVTLRLAAPGYVIATVLRQTGLDRSLEVYPTLTRALTARPRVRSAGSAIAG